MSVEEAAELARRAIYHATFRDGASGGVASGIPRSKCLLIVLPICVLVQTLSDPFLFCIPLISLLRGTKWMEKAIWR